jgi:hypothetical protein
MRDEGRGEGLCPFTFPLPVSKGQKMFGKTRDHISNAVSLPARNASLLSIIALAVSLVTLLIVAGMRLH